MKKNVLFFVAVVTVMGVFAAPPDTYYSSADGKSDAALRTALGSIIGGHTVVSYDNLNYLYVATDSHEDGSIWDMYSTCTWQHNAKKCGNYSTVCDCYNKEHSIPQSWFSKASPMKSDAFHVYPTDGKVNGQRSAYPYGECTGGTTLTETALGRLGTSTFTGYTGKVFEPVDEYKGDFARTYFYMATRYASQCESWGNHFGSANNGLTAYSVNLFLKWHREDPVSEKEKIRNDAIYGINNNTGYKQGNRNPFIDYPCLAEYIWGNKKGETLDLSKILSTYSDAYATTTDLSGCTCELTNPTIIAPKNSSTIEVGSANINEQVTKTITVQGVLLTQNLSLAVSGTNATMFDVMPKTVTSTAALAGATVTLSYTPTALGNHTATLTISSSEATSVTVTLTGKCEATLVSPTTAGLAFAADNVAEKEDQVVMVKGTNLSSAVNLSIGGTNANMFTLSTASVSAADANSGKNITVSYTPSAVGNHTATLVVASSDFTTVNVPLTGACIFAALEATEITKNSFKANWTNAGVTNYTLDVFTQTMSGSEVSTFFSETFGVSQGDFTINNKDISTLSRVWQFDGSYGMKASAYASNTNHATESWLISPAIDLKNAITANLMFDHARRFGDNSHLSVKLSSDNMSWTDAIVSNWPDGTNWNFISSGSIDLSTYVGGTVYVAFVYTSTTDGAATWEIKNVKVDGTIPALSTTSVAGYPKSVGNVQNYIVVGLMSETNYFYTVTPTDIAISEEIPVTTLEGTTTSINYTGIDNLVYYTAKDGLHMLNLQPGTSVGVFDCTGRLLEQRPNCASEEVFNFSAGVYVFKAFSDGMVQSLKVIY